MFSSVPTTTQSATTLTNPDEPTSSVPLESETSGETVVAVPLPSGLPSRIYPASGGVTADVNLDDYTAVSVMFDGSLGWAFVATNTDSAAQIFAYFPTCLQVALGLSGKRKSSYLT